MAAVLIDDLQSTGSDLLKLAHGYKHTQHVEYKPKKYLKMFFSLTMGLSGFKSILKPLLVVFVLLFLYIKLRASTASQPSDDAAIHSSNVITSSTHASDVGSTVEQKLIDIYNRKLKEIQSLHLTKATASKSCDMEPSVDRACVEKQCSSDFLLPRDRNVQDLLRRQYNIPSRYMQVINKLADRKLDQTRISFVTAVSANHFYECQGLMKSLIETVFPGLQNFRFYVYDLGLKLDQVRTLRRHCPQCHVRKFPFNLLPSVFTNLKSYTWKPLLVQAHLSSSQFVIWMDSSVRFLTSNLTGVLEIVRERGMLISPSHVSTPLHTDSRMYDYFGVKSCQMSRFRELEGTFIIFNNNRFTQNAIVLPWLSCAFSKNCMYPFDEIPADPSHYSCRTRVRAYGTCHRFDQSALTTILAKIYQDDIGYVLVKKNTLNINKRGEKFKYFPES